MGSISTRYKFMAFWRKDKSWYIIDDERDRYVLTDKAPKEAHESFDLYKKINKLDWEPEIANTRYDPPKIESILPKQGGDEIVNS